MTLRSQQQLSHCLLSWLPRWPQPLKISGWLENPSRNRFTQPSLVAFENSMALSGWSMAINIYCSCDSANFRVHPLLIVFFSYGIQNERLFKAERGHSFSWIVIGMTCEVYTCHISWDSSAQLRLTPPRELHLQLTPTHVPTYWQL